MARNDSNTNNYVNCSIEVTQEGKVVIKGEVINPNFYKYMEIYAAAPIDRMTNYSGSGLPFACAAAAFEGSPNYAQIPSNGIIDVVFLYPNGFNSQDAFYKVPPTIFIKLIPHNGAQDVRISYPLEDPLPLKNIGHRPNHIYGSLFYAYKDKVLPFATAEQTMMNYSAAKEYYDIA
jgi:hypothetical protein